MRKKKPIDDGPGVPEWIVSYGDVMSLLLCFFVLLFSFSTIDAEKWKSIVQSFSGEPAVINIPVENQTALINLDNNSGFNSSIIEDMLEKDEEEDLKELIKKLENELDKTDKVTDIEDEDTDMLYNQLVELSLLGEYEGDLEIIKLENEIIIRFDNQVLFESGKAILDTNARNILVEVLDIVGEHEEDIKEVYIEGNTDNVPISTIVYKDNFELSSARALVVLHHVIEKSSFPENKLVAVAYGEYQPIDTNETDEGRAKNRRTDIVILRKSEQLEEVG